MSTEKEAKAELKAAKAKAKALRPWYKKKRFWLLGVIAVIVIISVSSQDSSTTTTSDESGDVVQSTDTAGPSDSAPSENTNETVSQKNARKSAENYLDFSAFSRTGLIKQLEFEKYSTEDATYGVDAVNADWNEQAAKSAKNYLDTMAFSRSGLIDQLEFEGFTPAQAEYGVGTTGL
jgi:hypothetical protein